MKFLEQIKQEKIKEKDIINILISSLTECLKEFNINFKEIIVKKKNKFLVRFSINRSINWFNSVKKNKNLNVIFEDEIVKRKLFIKKNVLIFKDIIDLKELDIDILRSFSRLFLKKIKFFKFNNIFKECSHLLNQVFIAKIVEKDKNNNLVLKIEDITREILLSSSLQLNFDLTLEKNSSIIVSIIDINKEGNLIASRLTTDVINFFLKENIFHIKSNKIFIKKIFRIPNLKSKVLLVNNDIDNKISPADFILEIYSKNILQDFFKQFQENIEFLNWYGDNLKMCLECFKRNRVRKEDILMTENSIIVTTYEKNFSYILGKSGSNIRLISSILKRKIILKKKSSNFS